jgi:hypothetical protein
MNGDCMIRTSIHGVMFYCCLHNRHQPDIHVATGINEYGCEYVLSWKEEQEDEIRVFQEALEEAMV